MTPTARWRHAIKLASWPKILVPALLGQAIGVAVSGELRGEPLVFGVAFSVLDTVFIVLSNDWGDREVDAIKRRMFPEGCSPKTIPDRILPARHVLAAGLAAGVLALAIAALAERVLPGRHGLTLGALGCLALFVAYTFRPLRLNYRGGGELLEAIGVGVALPWWNAYLQAGRAPWPLGALLAGFFLMSLGSAVASGLSDEESDRAGGKHTFTTHFGNGPARRLSEASLVGGAVAWALVGPFVVVTAPFATVGFPAAWVALHAVRARRLGQAAVTNAFAAQGLYKQALHRGIWGGGALLAALLGVGALSGA